MKRTHFSLVGLLFALFLIAGCKSTSIFPGKEEAPAVGESVRVLVNGKDRGTTPQTIRVERRLRELTVELKKGRTNVRKFEIEETYTQSTAHVLFSFRGSDFDGNVNLNVEELPTQDNLTYVIPFFERPIVIEDRKYGLTLIVQE